MGQVDSHKPARRIIDGSPNIFKDRKRKQRYEDDFLKWYFLVKRYASDISGLTYKELEVLQFLYSEKYFTSTSLTEILDVFEIRVMHDKAIQSLVRKRVITVLKRGGAGREKSLYKVTQRGTKLIEHMMAVLKGEEELKAPDNPSGKKFWDKKGKMRNRSKVIKLSRLMKESIGFGITDRELPASILVKKR